MADFSIGEMQEMQRRLQEKYRGRWEAISPETGKNKLLWMTGEIGEVIDLVKKHGGMKACADAELRCALRADVLQRRDAMLRHFRGRAEGVLHREVRAQPDARVTLIHRAPRRWRCRMREFGGSFGRIRAWRFDLFASYPSGAFRGSGLRAARNRYSPRARCRCATPTC